MVTIPQDLWNTLFSWMGPKQCMLPEGCRLHWQGVLVYVFVLVFVVMMLYWFRHDIKEVAIKGWERIPNPFS